MSISKLEIYVYYCPSRLHKSILEDKVKIFFYIKFRLAVASRSKEENKATIDCWIFRCCYHYWKWVFSFLVVGTAWFLGLGLPKPSQILALIGSNNLG